MDERQLGREFAEAFAAKDFERVATVLDPEVDFLGLTPRRSWEAASADEFVSNVLPRWLEETDEIDELLTVETGGVGDRERVGYQLRGHNGDGPFVVEQQAYYATENGRIIWLRILCSGFRPVD